MGAQERIARVFDSLRASREAPSQGSARGGADMATAAAAGATADPYFHGAHVAAPPPPPAPQSPGPLSAAERELGALREGAAALEALAAGGSARGSSIREPPAAPFSGASGGGSGAPSPGGGRSHPASAGRRPPVHSQVTAQARGDLDTGAAAQLGAALAAFALAAPQRGAAPPPAPPQAFAFAPPQQQQGGQSAPADIREQLSRIEAQLSRVGQGGAVGGAAQAPAPPLYDSTHPAQPPLAPMYSYPYHPASHQPPPPPHPTYGMAAGAQQAARSPAYYTNSADFHPGSAEAERRSSPPRYAPASAVAAVAAAAAEGALSRQKGALKVPSA